MDEELRDDYYDFFDQADEMENAINQEAEERAKYDQYNIDEAVQFDTFVDEQTSSENKESETAKEENKNKANEFAHNISQGIEREKLAFSKNPIKYIGNLLYNAAVFIATAVGDIVRSVVFGYSRPFDWQNMIERKEEQEILKNAVKEQKKADKEQDKDSRNNSERDTSERENVVEEEGLDGVSQKVKAEQQKATDKQVEIIEKSVETANKFLKSVDMTALYDKENSQVTVFIGQQRYSIPIDADYKFCFKDSMAEDLQKIFDLKDNGMYDTKTDLNILKGVLCETAFNIDQMNLKNDDPLQEEKIHVISSMVYNNNKIETELDTVYNVEDGQPKAENIINCKYNGKVFARIPAASLCDEKIMTKELIEKINEAFINTIDNPTKTFICEVEKPKSIDKKEQTAQYERKSSEEQAMEDLMSEYENKAVNDISITDLKAEEGKSVNCVGKISDIKMKTTKKGRDMCTFTLTDDSGSIKCVCLPKQYDTLKNIINDPPDKVRIDATIGIHTYKGKESIELIPNGIEMVELSQVHEPNETSISEKELDDSILNGYTVDVETETSSEESIEDIENRIKNCEYTEPQDMSEYEKNMAEALLREQEERAMDEIFY